MLRLPIVLLINQIWLSMKVWVQKDGLRLRRQWLISANVTRSSSLLQMPNEEISGTPVKCYARSFFEEMKLDAVTVSPYMGEDSVKPFLRYPERWVILLALTSNEGAYDFQLMTDEKGERLFERVLRISQQWGTDEQMMYVVGATRGQLFEDVRKIVPNHFLLVPGIGTQGGYLEEVCKYGMNKQCGLLVNSSRGIIYADHGEDYATAAGNEARKLQQKMKEMLLRYLI